MFVPAWQPAELVAVAYPCRPASCWLPSCRSAVAAASCRTPAGSVARPRPAAAAACTRPLVVRMSCVK